MAHGLPSDQPPMEMEARGIPKTGDCPFLYNMLIDV
jgi:hypothetical protein